MYLSLSRDSKNLLPLGI